MELHTLLPLLHWLPPRAFRRIGRALGFGFFSREENLNLLDRRALLSLLRPTLDRSVELETHRFLGPVSNLIMIVRAPSLR